MGPYAAVTDSGRWRRTRHPERTARWCGGSSTTPTANAPNIVCTLSNINTGGTNPAATTYDAANGRIDIDIENWYLEMASAGELLGMLTHELGVHSLADAEMTGPQIALETASNPAATNIATANANYPIAGQQPIDARQIDHVAAADLQPPRGVDPRPERVDVTDSPREVVRLAWVCQRLLGVVSGHGRADYEAR